MKYLRSCFFMFFLLVLTISIQELCFSGQGSIPVSIKEEISKRFSSSEIQSIEAVIESAVEEGLPVKYLMPRLMEAARKKVKCEQLLEVLKKKAGYMNSASRMIWQQIKEGRKISDLNENTYILAELLERKLTEKQWEFIASGTDKHAPVEMIIERSGFIVFLNENGYSAGISQDIAEALMQTEINSASKIVDLLAAYPSSRAKDIILKSLRGGKNIGSIKKELKTACRSETVKEVLDERRAER